VQCKCGGITAVGSPHFNAYAERFVRTIRQVFLDPAGLFPSSFMNRYFLRSWAEVAGYFQSGK
jgi:transposase InsO family protein